MKATTGPPMIKLTPRNAKNTPPFYETHSPKTLLSGPPRQDRDRERERERERECTLRDTHAL